MNRINNSRKRKKFMTQKNGKFHVGVVNGVKVEKDFDFEYREFASLAEARESTDWTDKAVLEVINSYESTSAKAARYQAETLPYRPDPNDPAVKRNQLIRNLVSMNVPQAIAEQTIDALIASQR
jgi:hypothetical protein